MTVRKRDDGFQADFMVKGVRYRGQFDTLDAAETWEDEVRLALRKGQEPPRPNLAASPSGSAKYATLGALFEYTKAHVWAGTKSELHTVRNARAVLAHFGADKPAREIGRVEIDELVLVLKAQRNSGATINRKLATLSRMLRTSVELGALPAKPRLPRQKEAEGRERFLSREEAAAIVKTLRTWSKNDEADLVEFLLATGCRVGEALSLAMGRRQADLHHGRGREGEDLEDPSGADPGEHRRHARCPSRGRTAGPVHRAQLLRLPAHLREGAGAPRPRRGWCRDPHSAAHHGIVAGHRWCGHSVDHEVHGPLECEDDAALREAVPEASTSWPRSSPARRCRLPLDPLNGRAYPLRRAVTNGVTIGGKITVTVTI